MSAEPSTIGTADEPATSVGTLAAHVEVEGLLSEGRVRAARVPGNRGGIEKCTEWPALSTQGSLADAIAAAE